jgi:F0F1-type ATP synthase assembly protein I
MPQPVLNMWALIGELGFIISLPLVILVIIGVKVDKTFHTTPLFIIIGFVLAATISTIAVGRKINKLTKVQL